MPRGAAAGRAADAPDALAAAEAEAERSPARSPTSRRGREAIAALARELAELEAAQGAPRPRAGRLRWEEAPLRTRAAEAAEGLARAWAAAQAAMGDAWDVTPGALDALRALSAEADACVAAREAHARARRGRADVEAEAAALEARAVAAQEEIAAVYDGARREVARLLDVARGRGAEAGGLPRPAQDVGAVTPRGGV
ncbi:MAG: hypothetical protein U0324_15600 [Polyangiales bacterium]